ncbi:MAG: ferredoxin [Myxococcales bacterium]|nr:ferredoxin [Myxococcales bacterium]
MKYTVKIDKQSCQSSGNCVDAHPSAFAWDDDDLGDATEGLSALSRDELVAVARKCPALAIAVLDADGNEIAL